MESLRTIKHRLDAAAAKVAPALPSPCVVFHSAEADSITPADAERLRIAAATGAPIIHVHFFKPPTDEPVAS
jgi:hypothetical protein